MRNNKPLSPVPPLVKYNYYGRIIYLYLLIMPAYSFFYQRSLEYHFYLIFFLQMSIFPHAVYLLAYISKNPRKFELNFSSKVETFLLGIWLPIFLFHPLIIFIGLVGLLATSMMGGGGLFSILPKVLLFVCGGILGGIIFGFQYSLETTLPTVITVCIFILGANLISSFLFTKTTKKIISIRKELKEQKSKLDKELEDAAAYVKTMLPSPIHDGSIHIDWQFVPSASLGGDAFGYHWLDNDRFVIYLLDVSGHGVGAALLSVSVLNALRSQSLPDTDFKKPSQVLKTLNTTFQGERHNDMFFTFWYGIYHVPTRILTYASAGHPPALLFNKESNMIKLNTGNFVIGGMPDVSYQQGEQRIDNDALLFVFSDGVYEIEKKDGSMWRFSEYISLISSLSSDEHDSLDNLYDQTLQISKEDSLKDDYTILKVVFI